MFLNRFVKLNELEGDGTCDGIGTGGFGFGG